MSSGFSLAASARSASAASFSASNRPVSAASMFLKLMAFFFE
jgi:hypothetical protein